jgi:hypothetical protein
MKHELSRSVELSPQATLPIAFFYTASLDGDVSDAQKRQLLAALGGDDDVLQFAATYVQSIGIEQFLQAAPSILSTQEKLSVLVNVCDLLLTDRQPVPAQAALFERMLKAFGLSPEAFAPYYKTIFLKNDPVVLGAYDAEAATSEQLNVHVALAASLLYTMAASGSIAAENMGQLQTLIGQFTGLQGIALGFVRRVKFNQFLPQASARLTGPQKLYILIHACDALLSDGRIEDLERQMFQAMLTAFGYSERSFRPYFHTLELKHAKPLDDLVDSASTRAPGGKPPRTFETRSIRVGDKTKALEGGADANVAYINPNPSHNANIQRVGQEQATLNRQTLEGESPSLNRQTVASDEAAINRQAVASDEAAINRQTLASDATALNRQPLTPMVSPATNQQLLDPDGLLGDNRQAVGVDRFDDERALITDEERLKDLDFIIDNLQRKIDQFERKNKTVLREATQAKLTHPPTASDEIAQISTPHHPRAVATSHLQVEKAAERILDLQDEARDWNVIWISSVVAIVCLTCAMSVRIVLG